MENKKRDYLLHSHTDLLLFTYLHIVKQNIFYSKFLFFFSLSILFSMNVFFSLTSKAMCQQNRWEFSQILSSSDSTIFIFFLYLLYLLNNSFSLIFILKKIIAKKKNRNTIFMEGTTNNKKKENVWFHSYSILRQCISTWQFYMQTFQTTKYFNFFEQTGNFWISKLNLPSKEYTIYLKWMHRRSKI